MNFQIIGISMVLCQPTTKTNSSKTKIDSATYFDYVQYPSGMTKTVLGSFRHEEQSDN